MDRILITGALGQLGTEFIKHFERLNIFVYGDFNKKEQLVNIIEKFV